MNFLRALAITKSRITRGPTHVLAAVAVMAASFFVVTVFTFIFVQSKLALTYLESVPQVTAFLKDTATDQDIQNLTNELNNSGLTSDVHFVSRNEALATYKKQNADNPALLELVTSDYTPPSIQVKAKQLTDLDKIAEILNNKKSSSVDFVVYFKDVIQNLSRFTTGIQNTAIILLVLLLLSLTITSSFITGLQTYVNRDEIEIMRLLGATKTFVYLPFILEAVFYGIVSSLIASAVAAASITFVLSWFSDLFKGIPSVQVSLTYYAIIFGSSLLVGILTNLIGSYIAVRRYARV